MRNKAAKQKGARKRGGADHAFGCDLTEHLLATGQDVPQVLRTCAEFIEEHGIVDGIYRLSGVTSNIQRLRQEFVADSCPDLTKEIYLQDIHCVGSLCKLYFRELPIPLLTYELYKKFTDAMTLKGEGEQLRHIQSVVKELPAAHLRTLEYLSRHLSHLATLSHHTNMHARNLALVWAPNLLRSKDMEQASSCSGDSAFLEVRVQQSVVEFILKHTEQIFSSGCEEWSQPREAPSPMVAEKYATLPVPTSATSCGTLKLMSLEEAQARSLGANHPARQRENSLPDTRMAATLYHTVIDLNDNKRKLSSKSSKRWKSIFGLGRSAKLSRNGSVLVRAQDNEKAAIRPSKSMDSICSLSPDDNMPSCGNSGGSGSASGACNGLPMKSRTLGSEADFSLSDENLKVWGFSPKSPKRSVSTGASSPSNASSSATGTAVNSSQKTLPEQLKVFKGDEASGSFRPTSPKNRRMLFSSSSHHNSGGGAMVGSAPHLSFFPLESPSLSPRHQRKALNISEPFAVSVPLRVSAVISANSTPCRPGGAGAPSLNPNQPSLNPNQPSLNANQPNLNPNQSLKPAKALNPSESGYPGVQNTPDNSPTSNPSPTKEGIETQKAHPNTHKMAASGDLADAMVAAYSPINPIKKESAHHLDKEAKQDGRPAGLNPTECLLPALEEILSEVGATPSQNLGPKQSTPNPTPKILGEGASPEPHACSSGDSASTMDLNLKVTKDPGLSAPGSVSPGTATTPSPSQKANLMSNTDTDLTAIGCTTTGAVPIKSPSPKPDHKCTSAALLSEPHDISKVKQSAPEPSRDGDPSGLVSDPGSFENGTLVDIHGDGNLQKLHGDRIQVVTETKGGVQGKTLEDSMMTAWPEDELRIMENIPEERLASVQPSHSSSKSLKTNAPSTPMDQSACLPAGQTSHPDPLQSEFGPGPLLHLGALRETDILSDLEYEVLTSTPNQSSTKDHREEPGLLGSAAPPQTSCELGGKAKDLNVGRNDLATQETTPAVVNVLGDFKDKYPEKMSSDETLQEDKEQEDDIWLVDVEEKEQRSQHGGKERKQKGKKRDKGLDQVEPWEDLVHTQWVTSPLHTPTIEELFGDLASQNKKSVSKATVSQLLPETEQLVCAQEKKPGPSPKTTGVSHANKTTASRRNSSPHISLLQSEGRAENSQNPPLQWAPKVPASAAQVPRRFHRQVSHDSPLSPLARLHPGFPEQRVGTRISSSLTSPAIRNRPCSLDLDRDLDFMIDLHGKLSHHHRVIRDISNQPTSQQNVLDPSTMKSRCSLAERQDPGSATWRTSTEELELFLGNPCAPARRNSAPPPVGVASVRAPLTIRTSQAKAVPVIPPKVQYSSVPGSATSDLKKVPEGWKDSKATEEKPCGSTATAIPAIHPSPSSCAKEERENREPVPRVTPSPTAAPPSPSSPSQAEPLVLRRKHSPNVEPNYPDQMHLPLSASAVLRQRPSFRNRPRPQSLVLFSPPFPIMDHPNAPTAASSASYNASAERPHPKASAGLGRAASFWDKPSHRQEETRLRRDRASSQTSDVPCKERVENCKGSEGVVVLKGGSAGCSKMTLPKSGQRLETSPSSCFYQPQRRSMVLDSRSSRQIE